MNGIVYLHLSGGSSGKGRNDYFVAVEAELNVQGYPPLARLEVFSKRRGDRPPLVLELTKDDAILIGGALLSTAASMP